MQVESVVADLKEKAEVFASSQHGNSKARVIILGEAAVGTQISLAGLQMRFTSPMSKVVLFYDEEGPRIGTRALVPADRAGSLHK